MMNLPNQLQAHIQMAYALFSHYQFGEQSGVCTACCLRAENLYILQTTHLKAIPVKAIYDYLEAAGGYDNNIMILQMKYLLPRILELFLQGHVLRHGYEVIFDKLHCDLTEFWETDEIAFLQTFFLDFFTDEMFRQNAEFEFETMWIMVHEAGLDFIPLLNQWLENLSHPIVLIKTAEWIQFAGGLTISNAFASSSFHEQFQAWADDNVRHKIFSAFLERADEFVGKDKALIDYASAFL